MPLYRCAYEDAEEQPETVPLSEGGDQDLAIEPEMVPLPEDDSSWYIVESGVPVVPSISAGLHRELTLTSTCGGPRLDNVFGVADSELTPAEHALDTDSPVGPSILPFSNSTNSFDPRGPTDFLESTSTPEQSHPDSGQQLSQDILEKDTSTKNDIDHPTPELAAQFDSPKLSPIDFSEEDTLGRGASGKVYRAYHYESGTSVAIKVIRKKRTNEASARWEQYLLEMQSENRNTVELLGSFHDRRNWYIVTVSLSL